MYYNWHYTINVKYYILYKKNKHTKQIKDKNINIQTAYGSENWSLIVCENNANLHVEDDCVHACKGAYMWKWLWRWRVDIQFM